MTSAEPGAPTDHSTTRKQARRWRHGDVGCGGRRGGPLARLPCPPGVRPSRIGRGCALRLARHWCVNDMWGVCEYVPGRGAV